MSKGKKKKSKSRRYTPSYSGIPLGAKSAKEVFRKFRYEPPRSSAKATPPAAAQQQKGEEEEVAPRRATPAEQSNERECADNSDLSEWDQMLVKVTQKPVPINPGNKDTTRSSGDFNKGPEAWRIYKPIKAPPPRASEQSVAYGSYSIKRRAREQQLEQELHRRERTKFLCRLLLALTLVINLETNVLGLAWGFVKTRFSNLFDQIDEMTTIETPERMPKITPTPTVTKERLRVNRPKTRQIPGRNTRKITRR